MPETPSTNAVDPASAPILEIRNLVVEFPLRTGIFRAVDDVSITLHRGRTTCIVGESGSGKSVTAKSVLQILDPPGRIASGSILFHGAGGNATVDLAKLPPRGRAIRAIRGADIAMIFQEPMSSMSPVHRVGDQIMEAILLHQRVSKQEAREMAIGLLRKVEVANAETAIDKYPFEFSGGMLQRAMIAIALACNPLILIADEPTTALDVTTQAEVLDLIRRLAEERGAAVLFITHDMGVVAEIADEIVVMEGGKVRETGKPAQIFHDPQDPYTRKLVGSVSVLGKRAPQKPPVIDIGTAGPLLKLTCVSHAFGRKPPTIFRSGNRGVSAVRDVSLSLYPGETLGIVGESGSGKTSLGRCILRIYDPYEGSMIYTDGKTSQDLAKVPRSALSSFRDDIRLIFQDPFSSLNPRMTVRDIIAEPLKNMQELPRGGIDARIVKLLDQVGLPRSSLERYPHAFSGGQRQRIGIARALAVNPKIIIADEPTSALDVTIRTQILDLLLQLQREMGLSIIFISHDIAVVRYICDRIVVMRQGQIVETGDTEEVCENPQHGYTKALLSAVPSDDPLRRRLANRVRYRETAL